MIALPKKVTDGAFFDLRKDILQKDVNGPLGKKTFSKLIDEKASGTKVFASYLSDIDRAKPPASELGDSTMVMGEIVRLIHETKKELGQTGQERYLQFMETQQKIQQDVAGLRGEMRQLGFNPMINKMRFHSRLSLLALFVLAALIVAVGGLLYQHRAQLPEVIVKEIKVPVYRSRWVSLKFVNLRRGPSTAASIVANVPPNVEFIEKKRELGWLQLEYFDHTKDQLVRGWGYEGLFKKIRSQK